MFPIDGTANLSRLPGVLGHQLQPEGTAQFQSQTSPLHWGFPSSAGPGFQTLGLTLRSMAQFLKATLDQLAFFFPPKKFSFSERFAMQGRLDPLPQLETLERGPPEPLLLVPGVSWTTHCFSPAVTRCHSLSTSCPYPQSPEQVTDSPCLAEQKASARS